MGLLGRIGLGLFEDLEREIRRESKESKFWRYKSDGKECLIVHGPPTRIRLHPSSYAFCSENSKRHFVEGDLVVYEDVLEGLRKDLELLSCPVAGVHEHHFNERHVHLFCEADQPKIKKLANYLKFF